jgi:hypothetical protein
LSGEGNAPGISEDNTQLPALDDRTCNLIASPVETSVQAALAARTSPQRGDGDDAAARIPSIETDTALDPNAAQIRAGAGGASEISARGGSAAGDIDCPQEADEDAAEGSGDEDDEDVDADDEDAGGPQAFIPAWCEARRGRPIHPRFDIPARFDPHYPVAFSAESGAGKNPLFGPTEIGFWVFGAKTLKIQWGFGAKTHEPRMRRNP